MKTATRYKRSDESTESKLRHRLRGLRKVVIAYSGGVDSAFLAKVATEELGDAALCVTGLSPSVSAEQRKRAEAVAAAHQFNFRTVSTEEIEDKDYRANGPNRCFFCKNELYGKLREIANEEGAEHVLDGTNADDLNDHRPGRAAAEKFSVISPLAALGITKLEIREMSRELGLETWDIPASPCLASRIQYGTPVTIGKLSQVERGEAFLRSIGFREFRVRSHGALARLEFASDELPKAFELAAAGKLTNEFRAIGFRYVTVDTEGFRSGSMNEVLEEVKR